MATTTLEEKLRMDDKRSFSHLDVGGMRIEEAPNEEVRLEMLELAELQARFPEERRRKLIRKVDWRLVPVLALYYLLAWIDRGNMGNARLFGLESELQINPKQWNYALMVFFFSYAAIEVPSAFALKKLGPKLWLPTIILSFGIVTLATGFVKNYAGLIACRVVLGAAEGGLFPATGYVLSVWYTSAEIQKRVSAFYSTAALAGAFSGLLGYAIANLDGTLGHRAWRWIFWIEGAFTIAFAIGGYWYTLGPPESSGSWLTDEERRFLVLRKRYENGPSPVSAHWTWHAVKQAAMDWKTWVSASWFFCNAVANYGMTYTMPTLLNAFGYTAAIAQVMSAPPYAFACIACVAAAVYADKYKQRILPLLVGYSVTCIAYGVMTGTGPNLSVSGVTYGSIFFTSAGLYVGAPCYVAFLAVNTAGQSKRAVAMGLQTMVGTLGGVVGSNIYLASQKPQYPLGYGLSLGVMFALGVLPAIGSMIAIKKINANRAAMTEEEIQAKYTPQQLADMGDASPYFKLSL